MPYNDQINWPNSLDIDFPNLRNNDSAAVSENEKVYASHFNKVRNLIFKAYDLMQNTVSASGDGSFQKISLPVVFDIPLPTLIKVGAFEINSNPQLEIPGNTLPFEFVLTKSSDDYSKMIGRGGSALLNKKTSAALLSQFGGIEVVGAKIHTTCSLVGPTDKLFDTSYAFPNSYAASANTIVGSDTILIRGVLIDSKVDAIQAAAGYAQQLWKLPAAQQTFVRLAVCALYPQ